MPTPLQPSQLPASSPETIAALRDVLGIDALAASSESAYVFEQGVVTPATQTAGIGTATCVAQDPVTRSGIAQITIRGGTEAGIVNFAAYSRSGKTFTKLRSLGSVAVSIDTDATYVTTDVINAGEYFAWSAATNYVAGVTNASGAARPFGGYNVIAFGLPASGVPGSISRAVAPQIRVRISEALSTTKLKADLAPNLAPDGKARFLTGVSNVYPTAASVSARTIVYNDTSPATGRLVLTVGGGSASGYVEARSYTLSGGVLTATGRSEQMYAAAGAVTKKTLAMRVYPGELVGVYYPDNVVSNITSYTDREVGYYLGPDVEGSPTLTSSINSAWMFRFDVIPEGDMVRTDTVLFLGDSIIDEANYEPAVKLVCQELGMTPAIAAIGGSSLSAAGTGTGTPILEAMAKVSVVRLLEAKATGNWTTVDQGVIDILALAPPNNNDVSGPVNVMKNLDMAKVKAIVIEATTNDYASNFAIGTTSDTGATTYLGAINKIVADTHTAFPHLEIIFVTPLYRSRFAIAGDAKNGDTWANTAGFTLKDFVAAEVEQAKLNHVACMDLYNSCQINQYNADHFLGDGVHPVSSRGHILWADRVSGWLRANSRLGNGATR